MATRVGILPLLREYAAVSIAHTWHASTPRWTISPNMYGGVGPKERRSPIQASLLACHLARPQSPLSERALYVHSYLRPLSGAVIEYQESQRLRIGTNLQNASGFNLLDTSSARSTLCRSKSRQSAGLLPSLAPRNISGCLPALCPRCASTRTPNRFINHFCCSRYIASYAGSALFATSSRRAPSFVAFRIALFSSAMSRVRTKSQLDEDLEGSYDRPIVGNRHCMSGLQVALVAVYGLELFRVSLAKHSADIPK